MVLRDDPAIKTMVGHDFQGRYTWSFFSVKHETPIGNIRILYMGQHLMRDLGVDLGPLHFHLPRYAVRTSPWRRYAVFPCIWQTTIQKAVFVLPKLRVYWFLLSYPIYPLAFLKEQKHAT